MASSQAVAEWNAGTWRLENEETWDISAVMVEDGGGDGGGWRRRESPKNNKCRRGHLRTNQMSPRGATPPEPHHQIDPVSGKTPFFISRLSEPNTSRINRR